MRVERMPTCSTVPWISPAVMRSPFLNGRSAIRIPAPKTFESVFLRRKRDRETAEPEPGDYAVGRDGELRRDIAHSRGRDGEADCADAERDRYIVDGTGCLSSPCAEALGQNVNQIPGGPDAEHADDHGVNRRAVTPHLFRPTQQRNQKLEKQRRDHQPKRPP